MSLLQAHPPVASPVAPRQNESAADAGKATSLDYLVTAIALSGMILAFLVFEEKLAHWFLIPIFFCGLLSGVDIVRWLRGDLDVFDPRAILACLSFHGFFLTPILHVFWDVFGVGNELVLHGSWQQWLGLMAILNAGGLLLYRAASSWAFRRARPSKLHWKIVPDLYFTIVGSTMAVSLVGQGILLWLLGGMQGMIFAFETDKQAYEGKGWLLVFAWPMAILATMVIVGILNFQGRKSRARFYQVLPFATVIIALHFLISGWRGSRAAIIWTMFWMAGIIHYRVRKLSKSIMFAGIVLMFAFMYFYGFYKERGIEGLQVVQSPEQWLNPEGYTRNYKYLILGDFARADTNAYILHNLVTDPGDYDLRWGTTYLGGLAVLIPRNFWKDRPKHKVDAGTEAQHGKTNRWESSRIYGLTGEAMLNFGPAGVIPVFGIFGWILGVYRRKLLSWDANDARLFLAPFYAILFVLGLTHDSDNLVFEFVTQGTLVFLTIFLTTRRVAIAERRVAD